MSTKKPRGVAKAPANRLKGEVAITGPDGTTYTFRPTINAFVAIEPQIGMTADEMMAAAERGSLAAMRAVIWVCLQKHHSDTVATLEDAGNLIDEIGLPVIAQAFGDLVKANTPESDGGTGNPPAAQRGTGDGSSSSRAAAV